MKRCFEFEVIVPDGCPYDFAGLVAVFGSACRLFWKGYNDGFNEYLFQCSSRKLAKSLRDFLFSYHDIIDIASSHATKWLFGIVREVESDEID